MKILLIEDDRELAESMKFQLEKEGYETDICDDGEEGLYYMKERSHDLVILDRMLPSMDGITVLQEARKNHVSTPVIMLTALGELQDKLTGLKGGADDYMVKPAPLPLLEAHVEAVIRRTAEKRNPVESVGALSIDYEGRKIYLADKVLKVTAKEFDLLEYFVKHKGMILSRDKILDSVWGFDYIGGYRSVDTLVKKLRAKLTKEYPYIKTVYGVGYCFDV